MIFPDAKSATAWPGAVFEATAVEFAVTRLVVGRTIFVATGAFTVTVALRVVTAATFGTLAFTAGTFEFVAATGASLDCLAFAVEQKMNPASNTPTILNVFELLIW